MIIESYTLSDEFKSLVKYIWYVNINENKKGVNKFDTIIPTGNINLVFNFIDDYYLISEEKEIKLPKILVTGILDQAIKIKYGSNTKQIGIVFTPIGFLTIFNSTSGLFQNSIIDCENEEWNLKEIYKSLENESDFKKIIKLLKNRFLNNNLETNSFLILEKIIEKMNISKGNISITELAKNFNYSESGFERFFKKMTGITPKSYLNIIKFNNYLLQNKHHNYYDQSHLIRSLKKYTGKTPTEINKECDELTLNYLLKNADFLQY